MIRTDLKIIKSNSRGLFNILLSTVYYRPYQVKYGIRNKIIKIRRKIKAHCLQIIYLYKYNIHQTIGNNEQYHKQS